MSLGKEQHDGQVKEGQNRVEHKGSVIKAASLFC